MMLIMTLSSAAPGCVWEEAKHAQPMEELLRLCEVKVIEKSQKGACVYSDPTQGKKKKVMLKQGVNPLPIFLSRQHC